MSQAKRLRTFDQWMRLVDAALSRLCGLESGDLPDVCYSDWYEDDVPPVTAARRAMRYAGE